MHRPIARSEKEKQSTMHLSHLPTYFSPTPHLFHSHTCSASPCNPLIIPARSLLATSSTFLSPTPSPHPSSCHLPRANSSAAPAAYFASVAELHVAHMAMLTRANKSRTRADQNLSSSRNRSSSSSSSRRRRRSSSSAFSKGGLVAHAD